MQLWCIINGITKASVIPVFRCRHQSQVPGCWSNIDFQTTHKHTDHLRCAIQAIVNFVRLWHARVNEGKLKSWQRRQRMKELMVTPASSAAIGSMSHCEVPALLLESSNGQSRSRLHLTCSVHFSHCFFTCLSVDSLILIPAEFICLVYYLFTTEWHHTQTLPYLQDKAPVLKEKF